MGGSPTGVQTLPMDFGQSLQVNNQGNGQGALMSQAPNYSSAVNITANPLLNYGQPQLGAAGGTPLTMRSGGISRLGYANGDVVNIEDQLMQQVQQDQQPQEQMMQPSQPPLQGMEGQQPDIKDPQQALDIIIQMLIAQGIPPEQAREIALQMVQAVAEGGMEEMGDQRIEARFGGRIGYAEGGITNIIRNNRVHAFGGFIGSIGKAIGSVAKGVTNAVKSVVKSPIGKAALAAAAIYATGGGALFGGPGFASAGTLFGPGGALGGASGIFGAAPIAGTFGPPSAGLLGVGGSFAPFSGSLLSSVLSPSGIVRSLGTNALTSLAGGFLGGSLSGGVPQQQAGELDADYQNRVNQYKAQYSPLLNPTVQYPNNPFYPPTQMAANGGRIGYQEGGIGNLVSQVTKQEFFGTPMMANGGRMGYELGSEVPVRKNQAGVKELDYRDTGGFVPPIGIKERADDIPAMLSNNEFVFTADAVRNAGGGDENIGAQRMYKLMKNLESGGRV
jgi:hypothetical protein